MAKKPIKSIDRMWIELAEEHHKRSSGRRLKTKQFPARLTTSEGQLKYLRTKERGWLQDLIRKAIADDIEAQPEFAEGWATWLKEFEAMREKLRKGA